MEIRPYAGEADDRPMQELQARIWPLGLHAGGLGWTLATEQVGGETILAEEAGLVIGWVARAGRDLLVQVQPGRTDAALALLDVSVENRTADQLSVVVGDADETLTEAVLARDFCATGTPTYGMWLRATHAGEEPRDTGYTVRAAGTDADHCRVEIHRVAWNPADLPWHPDNRPPRATSESSFTGDKYDRCRRAWLYRDDLDLVAVASDGTSAASCLAWFDPVHGVAEIEPLGVHPGHRRRGLAGLLCREVARRVSALGGSEVFINNGPNPAYPAPSAAYTKAGFRTVRRGQAYIRPADR